ncbi:acyltransferase family protein [Paraburkholderia dinghuensis]|uniref:Acyltransferase n=1 Tax=Paraburkholderia dinghuensis TaxID=2305225 RepID=A0A3N6MPW9_9BURK|nr:acyltransferase family protein [Paraburkholderia dinghuensis]RQH05708.1 acyltransferase [Paraburkholderia dinghuensis]
MKNTPNLPVGTLQALLYRPDIDGLRGLAVLGTVLFHAFPTLLPGGFVGVDVFFVISGFLITRILLADLQQGRHSIAHFYARRIRRIFPALALVMIATFGIGWFCLFNGEFKNLGTHLMAGAGFVSNLALWGETGYFDKAAEMKPLLHLWSLGIEEQFYIVWPPLLALAFRRGHIWRWLTICVAASFALNLWLVQSHPSAAFYLPGGRAWELLAGAAVAVWTLFPAGAPATPRASSLTLAVAGLVLCAGAYLWLNASFVFPGIWSVPPVLSACLLILAGDDVAAPSRRWLSHPAAVWLGKISYPLYLWHWPLLSFANIEVGGVPSPTTRASLVAISVLLSWGTVALIEKPIRQGADHWLKVAVPCMLMLAIGSIGWALRHKNIAGARTILSEWNLNSASHGAGHELVTENCGIDPASRKVLSFCYSDRRTTPQYALWGDSKAEALYWGLVRESAPGQSWMLLSRPSCAPLSHVSRKTPYDNDDPEACNSEARVALDTLVRNPSIHTVVIATAGRILIGPTYESDGRTSTDGSLAMQGLDATITALHQAGKRVVMLIDNPTLQDPAQCIDRSALAPALLRRAFNITPRSPNDRCAISYQTHIIETRQYRALVDQLQQRHPELLVYDPADVLCDKQRDVCPMTVGDKFLYSYSDHISDSANGPIAKEINNLLGTPR